MKVAKRIDTCRCRAGSGLLALGIAGLLPPAASAENDAALGRTVSPMVDAIFLGASFAVLLLVIAVGLGLRWFRAKRVLVFVSLATAVYLVALISQWRSVGATLGLAPFPAIFAVFVLHALAVLAPFLQYRAARNAGQVRI